MQEHFHELYMFIVQSNDEVAAKDARAVIKNHFASK